MEKLWTYFGYNFIVIGPILSGVSGQILKINLAIWSHWYLPTVLFCFYQSNKLTWTPINNVSKFLHINATLKRSTLIGHCYIRSECLIPYRIAYPALKFVFCIGSGLVLLYLIVWAFDLLAILFFLWNKLFLFFETRL